MKITLKTLQQQTFAIEIEPIEKVSELKNKIEQSKGADFPKNNMKLIYAGKILDDACPLSDYSIDESKFIVVMVTKSKVSPVTTSPSATATAPTTSSDTRTTTTSQDQVKSQQQQPSSEESSTPAQVATDSTAPPAAATGNIDLNSAESSLVLGADYENTVSKLCEMGYPRSEVERALRASFNNPDRAVEYLLSGIPPETDEGPPQEPQQPGLPVSPPAQPAAAPLGANPLEFLRNQPQFQQMREVIRQNPSLLNTVMQQIGATNPDLLRMIRDNQQQFVQMINEQPDDLQPNPAAALGSGGGQEGPDLASYMGSATITNDDKQAIERLKALGFPEYLVVQAYFACDKNENLAADFLLSQGFDD